MSADGGHAAGVPTSRVASGCHSMVVSRTLVVCVNIGLLLLDMGLAILLSRKSTATNLTGFVCCVPAISDGSSIGLRFLNVT
jgi:hypothetical protein